MTSRIEKWPQALAAYFASRRHIPFEWGTNDCCQFARGGIAAQCGFDPAADLQLAQYDTAMSAARVLRGQGGVAAIPGNCGLEEIPISYAQRGDPVLYQFEKRDALGLCNGEKSLFVGARGLVAVPTLKCVKAWRI